jgi:NAD-dependent deacetylase
MLIGPHPSQAPGQRHRAEDGSISRREPARPAPSRGHVPGTVPDTGAPGSGYAAGIMSAAPMDLRLDDDTWLLVLTGAGVSKESGIPTFRDAGGLWEQHRVEDVASPQGFRKDPALVWRFYSQRRAGMLTCSPNPGHRALAAVEARLGDRFLLATQNIDGLHVAAGSTRVVELHGNLYKTRCSICDRAPFDDATVYTDQNLPACAQCHARGDFALLRPHIVWFGEMLDPRDMLRVETFMAEARKHRFVFLAAGTSGAVYPAAGFVQAAKQRGAETWLVNAERAANTDDFERFVEGPSGTVLPQLFGT